MSRANTCIQLDVEEAFRLVVAGSIGNAPERVQAGVLHRFSTNGRMSDRAGWCRLFADGMAGVFGDHRRGTSDVWKSADLVTHHLDTPAFIARLDRSGQQEHQRARNADRNKKCWSEASPVTATDAVGRYLERRGFEILSGLPVRLRCHPGLQYWFEGTYVNTFPAMIAPLQAYDGRVVALHRTFLTPDGLKAPVETPKKLSPASGSLAGSSIRLGSSRAGELGVAEGIETALAAASLTGTPVVAAYSAGNLAKWDWPDEVSNVIVFADSDDVGEEAARVLCARVRASGRSCSVAVPVVAGADWADVLLDTRATQLRSAR